MDQRGLVFQQTEFLIHVLRRCYQSKKLQQGNNAYLYFERLAKIAHGEVLC